MKLITLFAIIGLVIFGSPPLWADSTSVPVSGYFTDSTGTPLDGTKTITYRIYAALTGGSALWVEEQSVTCDAGVCSTTLGANDTNPVDTIVSSNSQLFLTIQIAGESESDSRVELSAVPWALVANSLASGAVTSTAIASSAVTSGAIASSAVTSAKIAREAVASANIADSAITTAKISDGTIATADLADSSVTTAKVSDDTLDFTDLADLLTLDADLSLSQGSSIWTQSFTGTTTTAFRLNATSLTTGSGIEVHGPSRETSGVTGAMIKVVSDVNNIGNTNGLLSSAATVDTTNTGGSAVNLYLSTTNSNATNANTTYGIKNDTTDAVALGNINYGAYTKVTNTGLATRTKNVYGSYNEVSATGASNATTNAYGMYLDVGASDTTGGTINNYGLYVNDGASSTTGTSTKYGIYVESMTGADNNYAAVFAGGNVGVGTTAPATTLDVNGIVRYRVQTLTVAEDGTGGAAAATLTPTSSYVEVDCQDTVGNNITISETGTQQGQLLITSNVGSRECTILDIAGQVELNGDANDNIVPHEGKMLIYGSDRWREVGR